MAIKIFADAGSNLFHSILKEKECEVKIVSLSLDVSGKIFKCYDDDIDVESFSKEFYEALRNGAEVKTSLANPSVWEDAFNEEVSKGNQVICFTMASGISGTYQSACLAADMVNEEAGKEMVKVIDSKTAGFGEGRQALYACELVKQGKSFDEVVKACEKHVFEVRSEFTVGDIKFLAKTGRVLALVAKIASVLDIRPLLKGSNEAKITMYKKVRGRENSLKTLAQDCIDHIKDKDNQTVYITHCDDEAAANHVKEMLAAANITNVEIYMYDLVTGAHVGPGTVALFYDGENRD